MNIAAILHRLETEQHTAATEAVKRPGGRTEFDYGRAVGFYAGLEHAKELVAALYAEDEERRNKF